MSLMPLILTEYTTEHQQEQRTAYSRRETNLKVQPDFHEQLEQHEQREQQRQSMQHEFDAVDHDRVYN